MFYTHLSAICDFLAYATTGAFAGLAPDKVAGEVLRLTLFWVIMGVGTALILGGLYYGAKETDE